MKKLTAKKCRYYRESDIEQYTPECTGDSDSVDPYDVEKGDYCQMCGGRIKFKEFTKTPDHLIYDNY